MTQQEYKDELSAFAQRQRQDHPVNHEKDLSEEDDWHRRIIGGSLMAYFDSPSPELHEELAEAYPSVSVNQFRFHRTGDLWGTNCGIFADHLWQWTGEEMELLLQAYSEGVY